MILVSLSKTLLQKTINKTKNAVMGNLLYLIAVFFIVAWAIGFLAYGAGGIIHLLLVIALIAVLLRVIKGNRPI
jgi:cytochrome c biogenesis protein CcdA